jgi:hypothetical protein
MTAADDILRAYRRDGFCVVPSLFAKSEVEQLREHFMQLRAAGTYPGDYPPPDSASDDPLKRFPRMIHMHHWDAVSLRWLLDARLNQWLTRLMGREPYAVQTMLYFKPPGARGQALHQDQYYLRVEPGTCMAAWMALDDCDEANGCMQLVPGSHELPMLCTHRADPRLSFSDDAVDVPPGMPPVPVRMNAGDVLFFNGSVIHGSFANATRDRYRRALIGHYVAGEAERLSEFYRPLLRMNGTEVELGVTPGGGPCGVWVERDGRSMIEMKQPAEPTSAPAHE